MGPAHSNSNNNHYGNLRVQCEFNLELIQTHSQQQLSISYLNQYATLYKNLPSPFFQYPRRVNDFCHNWSIHSAKNSLRQCLRMATLQWLKQVKNILKIYKRMKNNQIIYNQGCFCLLSNFNQGSFNLDLVIICNGNRFVLYKNQKVRMFTNKCCSNIDNSSVVYTNEGQ